MDYNKLAEENRADVARSWHEEPYDHQRSTVWPLWVRIIDTAGSIATFIGYNLLLIFAAVRDGSSGHSAFSQSNGGLQQFILIAVIVLLSAFLSVFGLYTIARSAIQ
jgi:hypothetical protein